jgi:hypothetical protein
MASDICGTWSSHRADREPGQNRPHAESATSSGGASLSCAGHWPPKQLARGGCIHCRSCRRSRPVIPFLKGRSIGVFSCRVSAFIGLAGFDSSSRYITGAYYIAIRVPFGYCFTFNRLWQGFRRLTLHFWKAQAGEILKTVESSPYRWQRGQKCVPRPAIRVRRIGVWQVTHGWPVR